MWDYDKLFAEGNIVGISPRKNEVINLICSKSSHNIDGFRNLYSNNDLSYKNIKIQYIIRLDEHGNVVEKLFDREVDMPKPMPELETGMFVRITDHGNMRNTILGYVDIQNCRVIYQDGTYSNLVPLYTKKSKVITDIVEVYSHKALCFNGCLSNEALIWRSPEYQAYLDSKSN